MDVHLPVSFSDPQWLALLLLVAVALWLERRSLVLLPAARRRMATLLRVAVIVLLVLALAGLRIRSASDRLAVLFAVDLSESVSETARADALQAINASLASRRARDEAGVLVFADEALVERSPGQLRALEKFESAPQRGYTDLAEAIRLAVGLFPEGCQRRLVVFTDGNENVGNAQGEAALAAANDIPVDFVPLQSTTGEEVLVESVSVPEKLEKKKPFEVRVTVRSTRAGRATLRLFRDRMMAAQNEVELTEGKNIFLFPQQETEAGFHTYEAMIDTLADTVRDNNQAGAFTLVYGESKILLVGNDDDTRFLKEALAAENLRTDVADQPPHDAATAESYDSIVLCNVSAEQLSDPQLRLLQAYCGDLGGGLAMIGGEDSFGPGGYRGTPVEEALPVSMEVRNKKHFPSLGLVVLVDKSGSMAGILAGCGKSKIELAAEAAVAATSMLTERDHVGVIGFDSAAKWDVDFQPATDKRAIANNIRSLRASGGTDALPAINEAIRTFRQHQLQLKHIIMVSDGMVQPGDYERAARELTAMKVTVTGVAVGDDADVEFMRMFAEATGGRHYVTNDPNRIPRIFTKETVLAQRSYLVEEKFVPVVHRENDISKGIEGFQPLHGYVNTQDKDRAEILLKSHKGDPVLAVWHYRAGKSLAWTSDARDRWSADWVAWPQYKKFWSQAMRWVMRNRREGVLHPRVIVENGAGKVFVDAVDARGEFVNFLELDASVVTPDMQTVRMKLRQVAPGRYEGGFDARRNGAYIASVSGKNVDSATAGTTVSYPPEYMSMKTNQLIMNQIASLTGGRVGPKPSEFFTPPQRRIEQQREMWYHLLWLALAVLLLDIAVRRVFLDQEQQQQIAAFAQRFVPAFLRRGPAGAGAATLDALKNRKRSVRETRTRAGGAEQPAAPSAPPARKLPEIPPETREEPSDTPPSHPAPPVAEEQTEPSPPAETSHTARLLEIRNRARSKTQRK